MDRCKELRILDLETGLKPLRTKLPDFIQNEWRRYGHNFEDHNYCEHLPFSDFVNFLERQARAIIEQEL